MTSRTATSILEARGAFKKNPDRKRQDPVVKEKFPEEAPSDLSPIEVKWWHIVRKQVPIGVLTGADQSAVRIAAVLSAEFALNSGDMPAGRIAQMRAAMSDLGLSPAARAKLATKPEGDNDDF